MFNCLVVGLKSAVMDDIPKLVSVKNVEIFVATDVLEARNAFSHHSIDVLIMGGGLPLAERLAIAEYAFEHNEQTSVHMKDRATGPDGFLSFIKEILNGWIQYKKQNNG